jgi:hypothetical protein
MNTLKLFIFAIAFLLSTFLTSALPVQEKFVELSPVDSSISPAVVKAAAEKFFYKLSNDEYFLNRYYEFIEDPENAAAAEKHNAFEFQIMDLNGDGRSELFVSNSKLSISANYQTVVYSIEDNSLRELLETDGVFYVSTAPAAGGNYKTIRTNRHESALERSAVEFTYNAVVGVYQQSTKPILIKNKK